MKRTLTLVSLFAIAGAVSVAAQRPARAQAVAPHVKPSTRPATTPATRGTESAEQVKSFHGVAAKLGMTPDALQQAYEAALKDNPKLTRGQFIAANMVAHNLGAKNAAITTQAILDGLKSGKSIGQTLKSLGVSDDEAKQAEGAADQEAKQASASDKDQDDK